MTDLPPGWEWATLEDFAGPMARAITDGPFGSNLKSEHYTESGARVIRLQNIGDGHFRDERTYISMERFDALRTHEVREGDLVVASLGDTPPRTCLVPALSDPAIVKADCIRVRLSSHVNPRWVLYALASPQTKKSAAILIKGVGRPRLGLAHIRALRVPVPPLAEQRRVVTVLEEYLSRLDAAKTLLVEAIEKISLHRNRFIAATCTGLWASTAKKSVSQPVDAGVQDGELPSLPKDWRWVRLGDIADVVGGITKYTKKQAGATLSEVPYLRVANVQRGRLDLDHVATIRAPVGTVQKLSLRGGDVLLNEGGDRDKLGRGWIWEGQIPGCIHQNHVFRARIRDNQLEPKLLAWHANTFGKGWCERNGRQSVNLASISLSKIRLLPVPVPPQNEQSALVALIEDHLSELDHLDGILQRTLQQAEYLRRSLLIDAFAGRLVTQDPNDEPASVLLERIKAERGAQPKARRGRRTPKKPDEQGSLL